MTNKEGQINLRLKSLLDQQKIQENRYLIQTRGYNLISDFLSEEECIALKQGIIKAIDSFEPYENSDRSFDDIYQIHDLLNQDINFGRLLEDPRLQQLLSPLLDEYWIMYAATSSSLPPKGTNYANRLHNDCPRFHPGYIFNIGIIWALDDYTKETGSLKVLPGSHNSAEIIDEPFFEKHCIDLYCKAGDLIVFNAGLYHRTTHNNSENWRHSMTLNACRSFMKQRMDWVRFIPNRIVDNLNSQAKRIIGFDTRLPTSLEEFFVPEHLRLYKAGQG